jgi:NAD(P)-dependent dehydrogenase (short-subunit alcohol dehydrogenase family)
MAAAGPGPSPERDAAARRGWALITGAGRRIGACLALEAARAGYDVAVHARRSGEADQTASEVRALGRDAVVLSGDLADPQTPAALIAATPRPLTLLVNSASLFAGDEIATLTAAGLDAAWATNLRAPILLAQAFAAALPADRRGLVVNVLDQRVWRLSPLFFSYTISKAALWTATQTLAQALAPGIRVNGIGPGPVMASVHQSPEIFGAEAAATPLGAAVAPEEIAAALRYFIDAPSVTGQMLAVDGGQHLAWRTPDVVAGDLAVALAPAGDGRGENAKDRPR